MFNIEIINVKVENKGKYKVAVVNHKTTDGKVDSKNVFSFGAAKPAFTELVNATQGDVFEIDSQKIKNEKDGKEYWTWVAAKRVDAGSVKGTGAPVAKTAPKSSYESTEERAARQVYIVRQSSIANAIEYLGYWEQKDVNVDKIISVAKQFEDYVFNGVKQQVQEAEVS